MLIPVPAPYTSQTCPACGEDGSGRGRKTPMKPASVKQGTTEVTTGEVTHV